jgi:hypothetical protein
MLRTRDKQEHDDVRTQEERQPVANGTSKETPIKQETTLKL